MKYNKNAWRALINESLTPGSPEGRWHGNHSKRIDDISHNDASAIVKQLFDFTAQSLSCNGIDSLHIS
jgi:hypothetical protein